MKKWFSDMRKAMNLERREHKSSFRVYLILRALVIVMMIFQIFNRNYENVFLCILTLLLLIVPSFVQVSFRIELPATLEVIILFFIFAAEILGEIQSYYIKFPLWDTMLHTLNGFLAAAIGFSLVTLLNKSKKLQFELSPLFICIVAFCFSMTIGVVWEFFEFGMDLLFGMDMQKDTIVHSIHSVMLDSGIGHIPGKIDNIRSVIINGKDLGLDGYLDIGLFDTMKDLFVNFIGALVFSFVGYFFIRHNGKKGIATRFVLKPKDESNDYLKQIQEERKE